MEKNKSIDGFTMRRAKKVQRAEKLGVKRLTRTEQDFFKKLETKKPASLEQSEQIEAVAEEFIKPTKAISFDENVLKKKTKKIPSEKKTLKKEKRKVSRLRKIITSILLFVVVLAIGVVVWALVWGNDIIAKITGGRGNIWDALSALTSEKYEPLKTDENGRTNILAFGTSGYNMAGDEGNGKHDGAQLTDSIMAISINQKTGDVMVVSLPRDLKVDRTCSIGKVNEVYMCASNNGKDEERGGKAMMERIGEVLGMDFQYYIHINWGSLVQVVNILGGITVTVDQDIDDRWHPEGATGIVMKAGVPKTLNGEQALALARARHGISGGDYGRGYSQQKILIAIKDRIYTKNLSLSDMLGMLSALGDNLRANLSISEIKTMAHLTFEFDFNKIRQVKLKDPENNINYIKSSGNQFAYSYEIPRLGAGNYSEIQAYIKEMMKEPEEDTEDEGEKDKVTEK